MVRPMSSSFSAADLEVRIKALDTQSRLPGIGRLRSWVLGELAPKPGERVVDVGSGTGSHVRELASVGAQVIGVEPSDGMVLAAARRGGTFVAGSAYALPFTDASVDIVTCERVFQHLSAPASAAAEIARVLRPGGRVAVTDTDWATAIVHPGDPDVVGAIGSAMRAGITSPLAGRLLPGWLAAAGLAVDDIGSQALVQPGSAATGPLVAMLGRLARDRGRSPRRSGRCSWRSWRPGRSGATSCWR
jgi:SAM-dependent methyltransferase